MPTRRQLLQVIRIQSELAKLGLDLGGAMQFIVEQTLSLIDADGAAIELAEREDMVYRAAAGIARPQLGLRLKIDQSLTGLCVRRGKSLLCKHVETDTRVDLDACHRVGLRSMIIIPLKHRGIAIGALKALSAQPDKFQKRDVVLLRMLSDVIAAAMYFSVKYSGDDLFIKATHDDMTGLANRALFMDRLRNAVALTDRDKKVAGVLMIDMDGLKQINDNYGHRVGDAVILEFAHRLGKATRDIDTAARLGGDEFGVVLATLESPESVESAAARIDAVNQPPFLFEGESYQLSASIGTAVIPGDGVEPEQLLDIADKRMYCVKRERKDQLFSA